MKKIERLTKEQTALFPEIVQEWIDRCDGKLGFDESAAKKKVLWLYDLANLKRPKNVIVLDGLKSIKASVGESVGESVRESVRESVWESVGESVGESVWESVGESVRASVRASVGESVGESVWESVRESVRASVGESVRASVRESVRESVRASVGESVRASVRASVGESVRESVGESVWESVGESVGIYNFSWVGFYDFFDRTGIVAHKNYRVFRDYLKTGAWLTFFFKNTTLILRPPTFLNRDEKNRLHSTHDKTIAWEDGSGLYFVHGVQFSESEFNTLIVQKPTPEQILAVKNTEQRAVLLQRYGYAYVCKNAAVLDKQRLPLQGSSHHAEYCLFEQNLENDLVARFLKVEWYDKHGKKDSTFLGVPPAPEADTVKKALAWTFQKTEQSYILEKET